jgi:PAS domain S-box-containing protein
VMAAVESGQAVAGVVNRLWGHLHQQEYKLRSSPVVFNPIEIRFASLSRGAPLLAAIDRHLSRFKLDPDSPYNEALDQWLARETVRPALPAWAVWALGAAGGLVLIFFGIALLLRQRVEARTADLDATNQRLRAEVEERLRSEKDLRESEQRFRQIAEGIEEVFWLGSPDWQEVFYVSPAYETVWGLPTRSLYEAPMSWMDSVLAEDMPAIEAYLRNVAGTEVSPGRFPEYRIRRPDGAIRHISARYFPIKDESGRLYRVAGLAMDVTERKHAQSHREKTEKELKRRNEFIETILDNLPIGLAVNQINDGRATYVNKQFAETYGWPSDAFEDVEQFFQKVYPDPVYREKIIRRVMADIESGDPERMAWDSIEATAQDGKKRIISAKNIPLYEQNLMISTVQDVTEARMLQTQLQQAQKMEALGILAGGIAHDFNNILSAIVGYSELVLEDAQEGKASPEEIAKILGAAERAKELVKQILSFSRKVTFEPRPLNLNKLITDTASIIQRTIPKMISVELHLEKDLGLINSDPTQMEQVLLNLASNAKDAMPRGGRLVIRTRNVTLDREFAAGHLGAPPGEYARLTVSDSGEGMDQEVLEHIFEPFYTSKEVGKGTGLGLASAYGIIIGHDGYITCSSEPGVGTTFDIYLPILQSGGEPGAGRRAKVEDVEGGSETILLVDDEEALRGIGSRTLRSKGYQVITASSGEEALAIYRENGRQVDLVIMDLGMPGMGGHQALKQILSLEPDARVIIASGYSADDQVKAALNAGGRGYVAKPFSRAELLGTVRSLLDEN